MRNRQNLKLLFFVIVVLFLIVWFLRTRSPSPANKTSDPVEAHAGPADIYPDPVRTPGAMNPDITQDNIRDTICNPRWSPKSIRPPASYTTHLKIEQIREYSYPDSTLKDYEEDHFIPLELGGNPTDPKNLWPEPFDTSIPDGGAHSKDKVENYLHAEVCAGSLMLEQV
jgi:hypothetical protein